MNNPPGTVPSALPTPVASSDERHSNARDHPHCRANLVPPWQRGQSGNPTGRRANAWSAADYMRYLQGDDFTSQRLRKIWRDPKEPHGKRAAAKQLLDTMVFSDDAVLGDRVEARKTFESVIDRLEGTPVQSVRTIDEASPDPIRVLAELRAKLVGADRQRFDEIAAQHGVEVVVPPAITAGDVSQPVQAEQARPSASAYDGA